MTIIALYKKKDGENHVTEKCKLRHGREVWAKVEGSPSRILFRYNAYADQSVPWDKRFLTTEELSKVETPRHRKRRERLEQFQTRQSVA